MAKETLKKIDDKMAAVPAYNALLRCGEAFSNLAANLPKTMGGIISDMHVAYNRAGYYICRASNEEDKEIKLECLDKAHDLLFYQQNTYEYIVKSRGCTIGQANVVIDLTKNVYEQCNKWKNWIIQQKIN